MIINPNKTPRQDNRGIRAIIMRLNAGVEVSFEVMASGGLVNGSTSAVMLSDENGRASAEYVLGPEPGLDNHLVEARFSSPSNEPTTFKASGFLLGTPEARIPPNPGED